MKSIPRIDYISVLLGNSHDLAQHYVNSFVRPYFDSLERQLGPRSGGWTVKPEYNTTAHTNQYFLRVWGELADFFTIAGQDMLRGKLITRLDIRYAIINGSKESVRRFGAAAMARPKGRRNVQLFDSKGREKGANGRSTGGVGLAIGSHKSDRRVSVYARGNESPAVEIQLQGAAIAELWGACMFYDDGVMSYMDELRTLQDRATYTADTWLADAVGIELDQLGEALKDSDNSYFDQHGQLSIDSILSQYERLEPDQKRNVRARLAQMG